MNYPSPEENPICQCRNNLLAAFWCPFGHMTECHFPYRCGQAACTHLHGYDFSAEEIKSLEAKARVNNTAYAYDQQGHATAKVSDHEPDPPTD